jgi:hypothetical protein
MKYTTSTDLINEIRDELHHWVEQGKVDDSIFYPVIRLCLSNMGGRILPEKETVLDVYSYKATLPKDFDSLIMAMACVTKEHVRPVTNAEITVENYDLTYTPVKQYEVHTNGCGVPYQIQRVIPYEAFSWTEFEVLSIAKQSKNKCNHNCMNLHSNSPNEITIENGLMMTNFPEGTVYLRYASSLEDDCDILIPDYPEITEWVKAELRAKAFKVMYWNNTPDITQQLGHTEKEAAVHKERARAFYKRPDLSDVYALRNTLARQYKTLSYGIIGNTRYDSRKITQYGHSSTISQG